MATKTKTTKTTKTKATGRIALIAFDAVVKTPKTLKSLITKWGANGPVIPVEFSRISSDGRLTPVIDARNGRPVKTMFTVLKTTDLNRAITEVAKNQGITNNNRVGYVDIKNKIVNADCWERHQNECRAIAEWAKKNKFSAVVWNGLGVRFKDAIHIPFSCQAAMNYLNSLNRTKKSEALKYINSIPKFVETSFRQFLKENV